MRCILGSPLYMCHSPCPSRRKVGIQKEDWYPQAFLIDCCSRSGAVCAPKVDSRKWQNNLLLPTLWPSQRRLRWQEKEDHLPLPLQTRRTSLQRPTLRSTPRRPIHLPPTFKDSLPTHRSRPNPLPTPPSPIHPQRRLHLLAPRGTQLARHRPQCPQ